MYISLFCVMHRNIPSVFLVFSSVDFRCSSWSYSAGGEEGSEAVGWVGGGRGEGGDLNAVQVKVLI